MNIDNFFKNDSLTLKNKIQEKIKYDLPFNINIR